MRFDDFKHDITFEYLLDLIDKRDNSNKEFLMYLEWAEQFFSSLADSLEKILDSKNEERYSALESNITKLIENKNERKGIVSFNDLNELKSDFNYLSLSFKSIKENPLEFYKCSELEKTRNCISKYTSKKNLSNQGLNYTGEIQD